MLCIRFFNDHNNRNFDSFFNITNKNIKCTYLSVKKKYF